MEKELGSALGEPIGIVGNESRPGIVEVVSRHPLPLGTYVAIPFSSRDPSTGREKRHLLVGVVSSTMYRRTVPVSGAAALATSGLYAEFENELAQYGASLVRAVADVGSDGAVSVPRTPPPPNAPVYLAPSPVLSKLFSRGGEDCVRIGHLVGRDDVEVRVSVDALAKHLFITGTTGSGKSNTVAILIDRIASIGGMVIVYDVHGEYSSLSPESPSVRVETIDLYVNPLVVAPKMLSKMIVPEASATVQRRLVERGLREAQKLFSEIIDKHGITPRAVEEARSRLASIRARQSSLASDASEDIGENLDAMEALAELFREAVISSIRRICGRGQSKAFSERSCEAAVAKVEEFFEYTPISFRRGSPVELLAPRTIVVLNASSLDDEQRDYMLKLVADELLWFGRRNALMGTPKPVVLVIEEAHLFLSSNRESASRRSIERLAREGRKFGVCLFIVSQRPRNIDSNTVSQVQNFVFMKLVQEADQRAVMNASDMLTEDLASSLSTMDTGEALLVGEWIGRFPAFVKIDRHGGKRAGATPRISELWRSLAREMERGEELGEIHEAALEDLKGLV
ncbi:MAG: ATP-binding protein [Crenarchaeota archaeon]|nr:ATP-binding protein [Thermoproteota archaeon]